jgi:hypothetical protein
VRHSAPILEARRHWQKYLELDAVNNGRHTLASGLPEINWIREMKGIRDAKVDGFAIWIHRFNASGVAPASVPAKAFIMRLTSVRFDLRTHCNLVASRA